MGYPPHDAPVAIGGVSILVGRIAITLSNIHRLVYIYFWIGRYHRNSGDRDTIFNVMSRKGGPSTCSYSALCGIA